MKKSYVLFFGLMFAYFFGFSQTIIKKYDNSLPYERYALACEADGSFGEISFYKKYKSNFKAYKDTLFYEDFDGGIPAGWTIVNNKLNSNTWKWDTIYRQGDLTDSSPSIPTGITAIKSTTAANGFMSLPSDFYNTPSSSGVDTMDTYFESSTISHPTSVFSNSVLLSYQQYLRFCCVKSNRLVLQVSTDSFNTIYEFDATDNLLVNLANANNSTGVQTNTINIGCAVSGASDFKIRFLSEGNTYYFWMIDDITILDGPANDLALNSARPIYNEVNYNYNPLYGQIPYCLFASLPFSGEITNRGKLDQTNVELTVSIDHLNTPGGGPQLAMEPFIQ